VGTAEFHAQCLRCGNVFDRAGPQQHRAAGQPESGTEDGIMPETDSGWDQNEIEWEEGDR
jgi:hypothetical protein